MAKVIKLTDNNNVTLLPITDASYVQISNDGTSKSVSDAIFEYEQVTATALNDLDTRIQAISTDVNNITAATNTKLGLVKGSYVKSNGDYPVHIDSSGNAYAALGISTIDGVTIGNALNMHHYGECSTTAGTATKSVTISGFTLVNGAQCIVKFANTNTAASPLLSVNGTSAKAIYWHGVVVKYQTLVGGHYYHFVYNGSTWVIVGTSFHAIPYGECSTPAGTVNKKVVAPGFHLCPGAKVTVKFANKNTQGNATLNVNSLGDYYIYYNGRKVHGIECYLVKDVLTLTYDGTNFNIENSENATYFSVIDSRTVSDIPFDYPVQLTAHYKNSGTNNLSKGNATLLEIAGWWDSSGGPTHEVGFVTTNSGIWHRASTGATTWSAWKQILESDTMKLSYTISSGAETLTLSYGEFSTSVPIDLRYDTVVSNVTPLTLF